MGFFSGKKGGLPKWVNEASQSNYRLAEQAANRPYQAYTGQRVAGASPLQTQGFNVLGGIKSAADRMGAYQNPFTSEVIDRSLSDLERQRQISGTNDNAKAIAAKAYGGSRQGVADSLTNEAYARESGNLAANLRYQGFNTALGAAQNDVSQQQSLGLAQVNAGGVQQGNEQAMLDSQYDQFAEQRDYPLQQLAIRQSALSNSPYAVKPQGASTFSKIAQGATAAAGVASLFSDKGMKQDIKPANGTNILNKLQSMPVSTWRYKPEQGLGGDEHMGTMAHDFAKQFGGDGKTIDVATAIGANLLGVQQLAKKVKRLEGKK